MSETSLYTAADKLFQAMDLLTDKKLSIQEYDKTIVCEIESDEGEIDGAFSYKVTDGSSHFTVYSQGTSYSIGDKVYVIIPKGDMNAQKLIMGKYVAVSKDAVQVFSPLEQMIDVSGNIIDNPALRGAITANDPSNEFVEIWSKDNVSYKGYHYIGLGFNIKTALPANVSSGVYGVVLQITSRTATGLTEYNRFFITSEEMFGNPYRYSIYTRIEHLCDIRNLHEIIGISLMFAQNNAFEDSEGNTIEANEPNIFLERPFISFGYDIADFSDETILLGTPGKIIYGSQDDTNDREIYMRWIHKEDNRFRSIDVSEELPEHAKVHWYRYKMETDREDELAGTFWRELTETEVPDLFNFSKTLDKTTNRDGFKAIVEYPTLEYIVEEIEATKASNKEVLKTALKRDGKNDAAAEEMSTEIVDRVYALIDIKDLEKRIQAFSEIKRDYSGETTKNAIESIYGRILERLQEVKYYGKDDDGLIFQNAKSQTELALDLVQELRLEVDKEGLKGVYHIYDDAGDIINTNEASKIRYINAKYYSIYTGVEDLDAAEEITWYIPAENTMIEFPVEGKEFKTDNGDVFINQENCDVPGYVAIKRFGSDTPVDADDSVLIEATQAFRIKNFYSMTNNNIIICKIKKGGRDYSASSNLIFDVMGNNGTEATLVLKMCQSNDDGTQPVEEYPLNALTIGEVAMVVPHLYDETNTEIDLKDYTVEFSWKESGTGESARGISLVNQGNVAKLLSVSDYIYDHECFILQASLVYKVLIEEVFNEETQSLEQRRRDVKLTAYLPIAITIDNTFQQIHGTTKIVYDSLGVKPKYYKGPYKIYGSNSLNEPEEGVHWELYTSEEDPKAIPFYPSLNETYVLAPNKTYYTGLKPFCVRCLREVETADGMSTEIIWSQPILYIQNAYGSAMLNDWDGNLTIDEKNGTILSAMIGAGNKNDDNTFSGVLMGDMGKVGDAANKSGLGLYGFHHGSQSFGFNVDGTAFIGKSGSGRISFEGNEGTITSGNYDPGVSGMKIDLDDPFLKAYGPAGGFEMDLSSADNTRADYVLTRIFGYDDEGEDKNLMVVGNDEYYLQSIDYGSNSGTRLDLKSGQLIGHNFSITAKKPIRLEDKENNITPLDSEVIISSSGTPYIRVNHASDYVYQDLDLYQKYSPGAYYIQKLGSNNQLEYVKDDGYKYERCSESDVYLSTVTYYVYSPTGYGEAFSDSMTYEQKKSAFEAEKTKYFVQKENTWSSSKIYYVFNNGTYIPTKVVDPNEVYDPEGHFYILASSETVSGYSLVNDGKENKTYVPNIKYYIPKRRPANGLDESLFEKNKTKYYKATGGYEYIQDAIYWTNTKYYVETSAGVFTEQSGLSKSEFYANPDRYYIRVSKGQQCTESDIYDKDTAYLTDVYVEARVVNSDSYYYYEPDQFYILKDSSFKKATGAYDIEIRYYKLENNNYIPVEVYNDTKYITFSEAKKATGRLYKYVETKVPDTIGYYVSDIIYYKLDGGKYVKVEKMVSNLTYQAVFAANVYYVEDTTSGGFIKATEYDASKSYYEDANGEHIIKLAPPGSVIYAPGTYYYTGTKAELVGSNETYSSEIVYLFVTEANNPNSALDPRSVVSDSTLIYKENVYYYITEPVYEISKAAFESQIEYFKEVDGEKVKVNVLDYPSYDAANVKYLSPIIFDDSYDYYTYYEVNGKFVKATGDFREGIGYYEWILPSNYVFFEEGKYSKKVNETYIRLAELPENKADDFYYVYYKNGDSATVEYVQKVKFAEGIPGQDRNYELNPKIKNPKLEFFTYMVESTEPTYRYNTESDEYEEIDWNSPDESYQKTEAYYKRIKQDQQSILLNITNNKFELKSHDWDITNRTGLHLDIGGEGLIEGYGEYISSQTGETRKPKFILDWRKNRSPIDVNDGVFEVKWNGEVICQNINAVGGSIGGWKITSTGISKDSIRLFSKDGKSGIYAGPDADKDDYIISIGDATITDDDTGATESSRDASGKADATDTENKYFILSKDGTVKTHHAEIQKLVSENVFVKNLYIGNVPVKWKKKTVISGASGNAKIVNYEHRHHININGIPYTTADRIDWYKGDIKVNYTSSTSGKSTIYYLSK